MKKHFLKIIIIIFLAVTPISTNAENVQKTARMYKVYWTGVHIADLWVEMEKGSMHAIMDSYGIAKTVSKYSSDTRSSFNVNNGQYNPKSFSSKFTQRHGNKKIDITYNGDGNIISEAVHPPDNRAKRPAVPEEMKKGTLDPLTLAVAARDKIREGLLKGENSFSFNVYDGRRLARYDFSIESGKTVKSRGQDVIQVSFRRTAIAGFTNNELKRMKGEEPEFTLYLDTVNLIPVKADAVAPLGSTVFLLKKECNSMEECRK